MGKIKRRLIETVLPLQEIGHEAAREKYIRKGQIPSLHIWWSRKPLIAARLSILGSLLNAPSSNGEKSEINELVKNICSRKVKKSSLIRGRKLISSNRGKREIKFLDSFAGGGSIPLEALRLGCESYSLDLNPVSYIIQLCTIKYPQEYGSKDSHEFFPETNSFNLEKDVRSFGDLILKNLKERLGRFYQGNPNEIISHYLWARTITCPNPSCERTVPLMKNFWLVKKKKTKLAFKLVDEGDSFLLKITERIDFNPEEGTISQGNLRCPFCHQGADVSFVRKESQSNRLGYHLAAVGYFNKKNNLSKEFREPQEIDFTVLEEAEKEFVNVNVNYEGLLSFIPDEPAPRKGTGPQRFFSYSNYGFETFDKIFTKRQALALGVIVQEIRNIYELLIQKKADYDYAKAIVTYFALILDRMTDLNCNLTSWRASDGNVRNLFDRPTISMKWGFGETNPLGNSTGSWSKFMDVIIDVIKECSKISNKGASVYLGSATNLPFEDDFFDIISIDPPYYDYIIYSDISDFFYVWLKRTIGNFYPDVFSTPLTPKTMEIIHNRSRHNNDEQASRRFYEENLRKSFEEIGRVLRTDGLAVIMFTHRSTSAWESLLTSIVNAGFMVTASWPLRTEMQSRLQSVGRKGQSTVGSTIFLVCRKRSKNAPIGYLLEIKENFLRKINSKLRTFWDNGIIGSDFFISAIGPGMEEFSKYTSIEDYSGNEISIKELLDQIRSISTNYVTNELLKESSASGIDKISQFYLTFRWAYLDNEVEYDEARLLSNCFGVALENLWGRDGFVKKSRKGISLLDSRGRKNVRRTDTFVETMHKALILWETGEREELNRFLESSDIASQQGFWQFCQAVGETLLMGNKEKQLIEGFLLSKNKFLRKVRTRETEEKEKKLKDYL